MPESLKINKKPSLADNPAVIKARKKAEQLSSGIRGIQTLDTINYRDRDEYYGADSPYRFQPRPDMRMPGTSKAKKPENFLDIFLRALKILPEKPVQKERPVIKGEQDKYKGLV